MQATPNRGILMRRLMLSAALLTMFSTGALAQAKPDKSHAPQIAKDKPGGQYGAGKVNIWNASHATKEMLMKHGYKVVGVEQLEDGNVLYFRSGAATRVSEVRIEKASISPNGESVRFDGVPGAVLADVRAKLGM
jgi:hypothetical protein